MKGRRARLSRSESCLSIEKLPAITFWEITRCGAESRRGSVNMWLTNRGSSWNHKRKMKIGICELKHRKKDFQQRTTHWIDTLKRWKMCLIPHLQCNRCWVSGLFQMPRAFLMIYYYWSFITFWVDSLWMGIALALFRETFTSLGNVGSLHRKNIETENCFL